MLTKDEKGNSVLSRKDRVWSCTECNKEYKIAPTQCSCGASDKVFVEKDVSIEEGSRKNYIVKQNIIYDGEEIKAGKTVLMIANDRITRNLLRRQIIEEVK